MKPACAAIRVAKAQAKGNSLHDQKIRKHRKSRNRIAKNSRKVNR
jgi:hypothetical protein